jgi:hypothetical protein
MQQPSNANIGQPDTTTRKAKTPWFCSQVNASKSCEIQLTPQRPVKPARILQNLIPLTAHTLRSCLVESDDVLVGPYNRSVGQEVLGGGAEESGVDDCFTAHGRNGEIANVSGTLLLVAGPQRVLLSSDVWFSFLLDSSENSTMWKK